MKLLENHRHNQESVGQCGWCQPAPLLLLFLQGGDKEQSQGSISKLSHQLQSQEASMATSPQQLRELPKFLQLQVGLERAGWGLCW